MAYFPPELVFEILQCLPAKSVLRFKCLSKSFCASIYSTHFINSHLCKSTENFNLRKIIFSDRSSTNKFHVCDLNFDFEEKILRIEKSVLSSLWNEICGYCKGLILLYRCEFGFSLWNPSMNQFRDLPVCPIEVPIDDQFYNIIGSGLCYDESIDDYKVFCIVHVERKFAPIFEVQVWIYRLKSNVWKRSHNWNFPCLLLIMRLTKFRLPGLGYFTTDGILHWLCTAFTFRYEIVAFDVRKETFCILPQPDCSFTSNPRRRVPTELHVLEGCLCISYLSCSMPMQADLYIRKKDDLNQFTWTQLFYVTEPLFVDRNWFKTVNVLGYLKTRDKILIDVGMAYMVSYYVQEGSFGKVGIDKDPNWKCPFLCIERLA